MKTPSQKKLFAFCLLGRSGCGKGTQAEFLKARLRRHGKVEHPYAGDFFRSMRGKKNLTSRLVTDILRRGDLVPWWIAAFSWLRLLIERNHPEHHLVFEGSPRRLPEAELMDGALQWYGRPESIAIYLDVPAREVTRRLLLRARHDDTPKAIRHRMAYFDRDVLPVVRYYKKHRRLIHVNGNQPIEAVWKEIDRTLAARPGVKWPRR